MREGVLFNNFKPLYINNSKTKALHSRHILPTLQRFLLIIQPGLRRRILLVHPDVRGNRTNP